MNHDETPMWDDPAESSRLRQLLRAGRTAASDCADYDVDQGLARHLAAVQAGATMPKWAAGLAAARTATPLLNWLVIPMVGAVAFLGVWFVARQTQVPVPSLRPATEGSELVAPATRSDLAVAPAALQPQAQLQHPAQRPRVVVDQPLQVTQVSATERARAALNAKPIARVVALHHVRSLDEARAATRALSEGAPSGEPSPSAVGTATHAAFAPSTTSSVTATTATNTPVASTVSTDTVQLSAATAESTAEPTAPTSEAHRVAAAGAARSEDDARLEREMQMLAVAQRVLSTDPARALRLARQGDREFAGSMFSAERKQLGLLALVQLGRIDEARRLGAPFLLAYPNAPWSERLRRALATGRIPAP